jgi:hypothetical protein
MDIPMNADIEFLLSFAPCDTPADVPSGLSPMFYFTGTYEGDLAIARKIADIKVRHDIGQSSKSDTE